MLHLFYAEVSRTAMLVTAAGRDLPEAEEAARGRLSYLAAPVNAMRFVALTDRPVFNLLGDLQ